MDTMAIKKVKKNGILPEKSHVLVYFIRQKAVMGHGWPHTNTKVCNTVFLKNVTKSAPSFGDPKAHQYAKKHNLDMYVDIDCHQEKIRMFFSSKDLI